MFRDWRKLHTETTLASRQIVRTASQARESGYYIRMYYIGLNTSDESLRRIANRVARGGHNIGADDVLRRFSGRWEAVKNILPYCDEAHFFDNDNGFVEVAEYRNGELLVKGEYRPTWILELHEFWKTYKFLCCAASLNFRRPYFEAPLNFNPLKIERVYALSNTLFWLNTLFFEKVPSCFRFPLGV